MISKWKKEARQQFEQAHGKRRTRFQGEEGDSEVDSYAEDVSEATTVEPGEVSKRKGGRCTPAADANLTPNAVAQVKAHTRMRLARIDGMKVIRHQVSGGGAR